MMRPIPPFPCCFCDEVVLGISGQDDDLDTVYLLDGPDDEEAAKTETFGAVHLSCLSRTKWAAFWSNRRFLNATCVGRAVALFEDAELAIGVMPVTNEIIVSSHIGSHLLIEKCELERRVITNGGWFIPFVSHLVLSLKTRQATARRIIRDWEEDGQSSLLKLIRDFDLEHRLLQRDAIIDGILLPSTDFDVSPLLMLRCNILEATVSHQVFISDSEMTKIWSTIHREPDSY